MTEPKGQTGVANERFADASPLAYVGGTFLRET